MKLSTEIDFSKFETVDVLVNAIKTVGANNSIVVAHLNGGDNGANLVEVVRNADGTINTAVLMGTALSPARFIKTEHGIVPGLLYHGFVEIKVGYEVNGSGSLVNGREYWDLPVMGTSLNFYCKTADKAAQWVSVQDGAYELFTRELDREVYDRHTQLELRAVVVFDARVPLDELWLPIPLADRLITELAKKMGNRAPKTHDQLSGMVNRTKRFPLQDWNVIQQLRIRVIADNTLAFRICDVTMKLMDGDFDGDTLFQTLLDTYLMSMDAQRDFGTLSVVDALPDPESFGSTDFSLRDVCAQGFPDAVASTAGMLTKSFQGIITTGFTNLGTAGVIAFKENPALIRSVLDPAGLIKWADKPHTFIYNEFKKSLSPSTAICLDYRKKLAGDPARYADELWNIIEVLSLGGEFSEAVGLVDKEHKTIDTHAANALLRFTKDGLAPFLSRYPVQSNLGGGMDARTPAGKFDLRRIANMMHKESLGKFLQYASGVDIEKAGVQVVDPREINGDAPTFCIGWDKEPITWNHSTGESDLDYIVRRAQWAGAKNISIFTKVGGNIIVKLNDQFVIELDPLEFSVVAPKSSGNSIGYVVVKSGESKRYSRLILRSRNRNFGSSPEVNTVDLVTVLDLIAESLAQWEHQGIYESTKYGDDFDAKSFNARVKASIEKTLEGNSRLPGATDKGTERVLGEINITHIQCSIQLGRGNTAMQTMHRNTQLLTMIDENSFVNPLMPALEHRFDVGMGSKNHPGTVATLLSPGMMRETRTGKRISFTPLKPIIQYAVNVWLDTDRQMRETLSVRMACELDSPESIILNSGFNAAMPAITKRRRDGVWVGVPGKGWFFSDVENNGDMGKLTPYGMCVFSRKSRPGFYGPLSQHHADSLAKEITGDETAVASDLVALGYKIKYTGRRMGRYGKKAQHEAQLTLIGPGLGSPTWNKIYLHGHKFIATPTIKDYYLEVDGELVPILGFVPIESLVQKKMTGTMAAGLAALLGHTYFGNLAEALVNPARKAGDAPSLYNDIVSVAGKLLAEKNLPDTGMLPVFNEDGTCMGTGFGMILAGFVMREDDKLSTGVKTTGGNSLITMRACGDELTLDGPKDNRLSKHAQQTLNALSQFIATGTVDPKGLIELDAVDEDVEVGADYPGYDDYEPSAPIEEESLPYFE